MTSGLRLRSASFVPHLIGTIGIVMSLGCGPKSEAWLRAKQEDTPEAYRRFLHAEPGSKFADTAKQRMEKLDWEEAVLHQTAQSWDAYLLNHPTSDRADEARRNLEEARWKAAVAGGKARLQIFLSNHPDSAHAPEAAQRLDDLDWEAARADDTAKSYGLYLEKHFSGAHADEARQFYVDRNWQTVIDADTYEAYVDFLMRFPDSRYASHAQQTLEDFRFDALGIQLVIRDTLRDDSVSTLKPRFKKKLEAALKKEEIPFTWLKDVDARNDPDRSPTAGLKLEGNQGAMVIEYREKRGRAFDPYGYATDIEAKVHLVPKRGSVMTTVQVEGSTRRSVLAETLHGLHLDAQEDFGDQLATAPKGWSKFLIREEKTGEKTGEKK